MNRTDEMKRYKAKQLRYKKPIVRYMNYDFLLQELEEISCECDEIRYYMEADDETLLNALDGDSDDAYEFRMAFCDLSAECEQMWEDLRQEYVPKYFDTFFAAVGAGNYGGGYLGWDTFEHDYYGIDCPEEWCVSEAAKKIKRLSKDEMIEAVGVCLKILYAYIGIRYRYDSLKAAFDIIKEQNTGVLKTIKAIEELYDKAEKESDGFTWKHGETILQLENLFQALPQEAWIA